MSELLTLAGAALLYTVLAMWATAPPYTCAMTETHRPLYLDGDVDREHIQRDVLAIPRVARRYASHLPAEARSDTPAVDRAVKQCEDELARSLMATHDLTVDEIRLDGIPPQRASKRPR